MTEKEHKNLTVVIHLLRYIKSYGGNADNRIEISFLNYHLTVKPKHDMEEQIFVFKLNDDLLNLVEGDAENIEFSFSKTSSKNQIYIELKSKGFGDCESMAVFRIEAIKIYDK